jgi:hypothetical protein
MGSFSVPVFPSTRDAADGSSADVVWEPTKCFGPETPETGAGARNAYATDPNEVRRRGSGTSFAYIGRKSRIGPQKGSSCAKMTAHYRGIYLQSTWTIR